MEKFSPSFTGYLASGLGIPGNHSQLGWQQIPALLEYQQEYWNWNKVTSTRSGAGIVAAILELRMPGMAITELLLFTYCQGFENHHHFRACYAQNEYIRSC